MPILRQSREQVTLGSYVLRWFCLAGSVGLAVGSACALFLWALDWATSTRLENPALLYGLPFAGIAIAALYQSVGRSAEGGTNLLMDEIHQPGGAVPRRMAPLILLATVMTHLFGGSAGREGTAVQMGGSLAAAIGRAFRLDASDIRTLLMCGIAAGFGGVFGTPLAGAVFALEVLTVGQLNYTALVPCLIASLTGDWACDAWGIHHTQYAISPITTPALHSAATGAFDAGSFNGLAFFDWSLAARIALASVAFGWVSILFIELTHGIQATFQKIRPALLRPFIGGVCVICLVLVLGTRDYLGLGVSSPDPQSVTILSSFIPGGAETWSWWWKLLFTAITLGSGFKGGEVTPLFFIGATLGHTLGRWLHAPIDLFAGLGFVAVFAGATNTPIACTLMAIELFGAEHTAYFVIACFLAHAFSGHSGIYASQRIGPGRLGTAKYPWQQLRAATTVREVRAARQARIARRLQGARLRAATLRAKRVRRKSNRPGDNDGEEKS
jgi:H+/Cl- antiporter ClcA